jgi:flagella basal body P-ring formation protein FlgA
MKTGIAPDRPCRPRRADSLVAVRTLPAHTVIAAEDLTLVDAEIAGALTDPPWPSGKRPEVAIYAGRPVRPGDLGPPALVERNQVSAWSTVPGRCILAEGRSLARGGEGETIRVINLTSRTTVTGRIGPDGAVLVGDPN